VTPDDDGPRLDTPPVDPALVDPATGAATGSVAQPPSGPAADPDVPPTRAGGDRTVVHMLRHGEVHNPEGVLYGRLPGYHLSDLGRRMADRAAGFLANRDIAEVVCSPMERAQETATPVAVAHGLEIVTDERIIESTSHFEGLTFGVGDGSIRHPEHWKYLINPFRPSWGEAYTKVAERMLAAAVDARDRVRGREVVLVSHQLPIWVARLSAERRRLWHNPARRQCSLASVTTLIYEGERLVAVEYAEPCRDLLPVANKTAGA
jgi:broad specificity phosphatase PhoE